MSELTLTVLRLGFLAAALDLRAYRRRRHAHRSVRPAGQPGSRRQGGRASKPAAEAGQAAKAAKTQARNRPNAGRDSRVHFAGTSITLGTTPITIGRSPDSHRWSSTTTTRRTTTPASTRTRTTGSSRTSAPPTAPTSSAPRHRSHRRAGRVPRSASARPCSSCESDGRPQCRLQLMRTPPAPTSGCSATATRTRATPVPTCSRRRRHGRGGGRRGRQLGRDRCARSPRRRRTERRPPRALLGDTLTQAEGQLDGTRRGRTGLQGMGTTLTAMLRSGHRLGLVHVGDSRGLPAARRQAGAHHS